MFVCRPTRNFLEIEKPRSALSQALRLSSLRGSALRGPPAHQLWAIHNSAQPGGMLLLSMCCIVTL
jgi:hypothetical protein